MRRLLVPRTLGRSAGTPPAGRLAVLAGETMGTTWRASVVAPKGVRLAALRAAIERALDGVVAEMSDWEPRSDISRFNRAPAGARQALPPAFAAVLRHGLDLREASGGAYDPAAGRLTQLWGFGAEPSRDLPPSGAAIAEALAARGVTLDGNVATQPGGARLDLSSIAKGHGVDAAAAALREGGASAFLVEVGGELFGEGVKPDGSPWWVEIEPPPGASLRETWLALHGQAVATSGDYRKFNALGAHTIDPRTGRPVANGLASVTVVMESAMAADAMATALMVLGEEEGRRFAKERGVAALFVRRVGDGFEETMTAAMGAMLG